MALHRGFVVRAERLREVARELPGQVGILGNIGAEQRLEDGHLAVGHEDAEFRTGQPLTALAPLGDLVPARQEFEFPVEDAAGFEHVDHVCLGTEALDR